MEKSGIMLACIGYGTYKTCNGLLPPVLMLDFSTTFLKHTEETPLKCSRCWEKSPREEIRGRNKKD